MARSPLLLFALLLFFVDEVCSFTPNVTSALTAKFCGTVPSENIIMNIVAQNGQTSKVVIQTEVGSTTYKIKIPNSGLGQNATFKYQFEQTTFTEVTLSSAASQICVNALVVNTAVVVDQPTDFLTACPKDTSDDVPDRPCKQLGNPINMSSLFICPQRLKEILLKESLIASNPTTEPKRGEPPIYDITNDMAQASLAIATGISEYGDVITQARRNYRESKSVNPLRRISNIALSLETAKSFISTFTPVFGMFSGIASILITFLTPNPFDELAKYLDEQFRQVNDQLFNIQTDIADLGRLIEAKSGVLGMTKQIRALRHSTRNYGVMMNALSTRPVCGTKESFQMKEVSEFMTQYEADNVDNCLLDLYAVEFGELTEATSLLRPYMLAYCHNKQHLVQKLAEELIHYGYAGLQFHFTYYNVNAAFKGGDFQVDDAWLKKLYKFVKKVTAFKEASNTTATESSLTNSLQFDFEDEILVNLKVKQKETTFMNWWKKRIINEHDWPYHCLLKDANGVEKRNSLLLLYINVTSDTNTRVLDAVLKGKSQTRYHIPSTHGYFRALRETAIMKDFGDCDSKKHNLIVVFYCPNLNICGQSNYVIVSWSRAYLCVFEKYKNKPRGEFIISRHKVFIPKEWLDTADRF